MFLQLVISVKFPGFQRVLRSAVFCASAIYVFWVRLIWEAFIAALADPRWPLKVLHLWPPKLLHPDCYNLRS
jgi:hypothetical protein